MSDFKTRFYDVEQRPMMAAFTSEVHSKETLTHFYTSEDGSKCAKNDYTSVSYRIRNLQLADWIEKAKDYEWEDEKGTLTKAVRRLRWCSSVAIIKSSPKETKIHQTSKTCKSAHCALCLRQRSTKISQRLMDALVDKENENFFKTYNSKKKQWEPKYFYFLTFTVKHDEETRTGIYLDEFKKLVQKMYRSKFWKSYFPYSKAEPESGWITAYETTFGVKQHKGYHIHAHTLLCAPRLKVRVKDFQKNLQERWLKITKDSFNVQFDLLKLMEQKKVERPVALMKSNEILESDELVVIQNGVYKAVRELIKYGTKVGNFKDWNQDKADLFGDWICQTKGKNFINCSGFFRSMQITGAKSRYDKPREDEPESEHPDTRFFVGKTSSIKFNHTVGYMGTKKRKRAMKNIKLKSAKDFLDFTDFKDEFNLYRSMGYSEKEVLKKLNEFIYWQEKGKADSVEFDLSRTEVKSRIEAMYSQMKMFNAEQEHRK